MLLLVLRSQEILHTSLDTVVDMIYWKDTIGPDERLPVRLMVFECRQKSSNSARSVALLVAGGSDSRSTSGYASKLCESPSYSTFG